MTQQKSDVLDPRIFTDDTNHFYSNNDIGFLFLAITKELKNVKWFNTNKLSLNVGKTKYGLFHKSQHTAAFVIFKYQL